MICPPDKSISFHNDFLRKGNRKKIKIVSRPGLVQLFNCQLLPKNLVEAEDFVDPSGRVALFREEERDVAKVETGFLNSFMSFISTGGETPMAHRQRTPEEEEHAKSGMVTN